MEEDEDEDDEEEEEEGEEEEEDDEKEVLGVGVDALRGVTLLKAEEAERLT